MRARRFPFSAVLLSMALAVSASAALFSSPFPDGLEKMLEDLSKLPAATALDPRVEHAPQAVSFAERALEGAIGCALVLATCVALGQALRRQRRA